MKRILIVLFIVLTILIAGIYAINTEICGDKSDNLSNGITIIVDGTEKEVTEKDLNYILNEQIPYLIKKINSLSASQK